MKLSAAMIVRDADETLEACLESVRPHVDELVIVDMGSTDNTVELARKYADKVELFLGCNDAESGLIEDFSAARNRSWDLVTGDAVLWIDSDDVLVGGEHIRDLLSASKSDNTCVMAPYEYAHDENGRVTCVHWRERVLAPPRAFTWMSPIHEVCLPVQPIQGALTTVRTDAFKIVHRRHLKKRPVEQGRNLRILKSYYNKVHEADVRALYYLGVECSYVGDLGPAIRFLRRYVQLSNWADEKCLALIELSRIYSQIGDYDTAIFYALEASTVRAWPEPYWRLGRIFYALAMQGHPAEREYNFKRAAEYLKRGLEIGENDTVLFVDPQEKYRIHEFLNVCLSALGDIGLAIESCESGLVGLPGNEHLQNNLRIYRQARAVENLKKSISDVDMPDAQRAAFEGLVHGIAPAGAQAPAAVASTTTIPAPPPIEHRAPAPGKLDIVFLVGYQLEPWCPTTVEQTGIGGSETMVMNLARELALMGHAVRVYGQCTPSMEGIYDGVEYLDAAHYHDVTCDVLISSRKPEAVDDDFRVNAALKILYVHDVHCGRELNFVRELRYDKILCLSEWHKKFFANVYAKLNPDKIHVTRNAVDVSRFGVAHSKESASAIYSSSPDRGLAALLDMWPDVRKAVPNAILRVYYSFDNWRKMANMSGAQDALRTISHLEHLVKNTAGVEYKGRVNQKELAEAFMGAGAWLYPTWFHETSCITAMEAQAAGCAIVTTAQAALNETVGDRGTLIPWGRTPEDPTTSPTPEYRKAFIAAAIEALTNTTQIRRDAIREYALKAFDLKALAAEWDSLFTVWLETARARVVPEFYDGEAAAQ